MLIYPPYVSNSTNFGTRLCTQVIDADIGMVSASCGSKGLLELMNIIIKSSVNSEVVYFFDKATTLVTKYIVLNHTITQYYVKSTDSLDEVDSFILANRNFLSDKFPTTSQTYSLASDENIVVEQISEDSYYLISPLTIFDKI